MKREQIFVFTGPTLSPTDAQAQLDAVYLPPARLGDVYRVCELYQPRIIAVIDGYFNQAPAVWHKELMAAMNRGITVFGAASMGALRAAELCAFGMIGVGQIYEAYRTGELPPFSEALFEDDDEVAVIHGPAELGYLPASDAMVNIRMTLAAAHAQEVIEDDVLALLIRLAKERFYAERNYRQLLELANESGLAKSTVVTLRGWIEDNAIDQKKLDARLMLDRIAEHSHEPFTNESPTTGQFTMTHQWRSAVEEIDRSHQLPQPLINELRLRGTDYRTTRHASANRPRHNPRPSALQPSPAGLTRLHNRPEELEQRFVSDWQARFNEQASGSPSATWRFEKRILDHLSDTDEYTALEARANHKQHVLAQLKPRPGVESLNELHRLQLCDWYFTRCLAREMPDSIEDYIAELDLEAPDTFYAMILDEYLYLEAIKQRA